LPAAILRLGERQGRKIVVDDVYDEATDPDAELEDGDEPQFFVTVVPYVDRDDIDAISEELDAEQWADLIETDGIRHRLESSRPRTELTGERADFQSHCLKRPRLSSHPL